MTFIIGLILGAATLIFVFQNMMIVSVTFLGWHTTGNLAFIIALSVILGMIISWLLSLPDRLEISDLSRNNRKLVKELEEKKLKLSETQGKLSQAETPVVIENTLVE